MILSLDRGSQHPLSRGGIRPRAANSGGVDQLLPRRSVNDDVKLINDPPSRDDGLHFSVITQIHPSGSGIVVVVKAYHYDRLARVCCVFRKSVQYQQPTLMGLGSISDVECN